MAIQALLGATNVNLIEHRPEVEAAELA